MTEYAPETGGRSPSPPLPRSADRRRLISRWLRTIGVGALLGALLIVLLSQLPSTHTVDLGGADAAYTQGWLEPEVVDGVTARWTSDASVLLFPQAGLPGELTLRLRGRSDDNPANVRLLLNGSAELAFFSVGSAWVEQRVRITGGALKASDFFVQIAADQATLVDGRTVGVLVEQAMYRTTPPTLPYPTQVVYGALIGGLLAALGSPKDGRQPTGDRRRKGALFHVFGLLRSWLGIGLAIYAVAWLFFYKLALPVYPYPLRMFPPLAVLGLGSLAIWRYGPALAVRAPVLVSRILPLLVIGGWTAATLLAARDHVTLSRPGVENDFRVFATRETLAQIFQTDGFYNLGYPFLLWLVRPFTDGNAFLAARLVAALTGAVFLAASYGLARRMLPAGPALLALIILALSGFVAQYGLYIGSDMPFAACVALCLALLLGNKGAKGQGEEGTRGQGGKETTRILSSAKRVSKDAGQGDKGIGGQGDRGAKRRTGVLRHLPLGLFLAGMCGGLAFLMRHPGMLLLPWGLLVLWIAGQRSRAALLAFALGFGLAAAPQIIVNTVQAGQPLYSQQAKNIWLAVYGGTDWGRWDEAPNDIGLVEVVLRDPLRFAGNWWRNMVAFSGSGAEDTSEFGRAVQLRMLNWPANWLAIGGLALWAWVTARSVRPDRRIGFDGAQLGLLALIGLYVAAISTAFLLQRFVLPLAPIYAVAAGWAAWRMIGGGRRMLAFSLALIVVLWGGFGAGQRYVLANQPPEEVAAVRMVQQTVPADALIAARVADRLPLAKYSALAHQVVDWPVGSDLSRPITAADIAAAQAAGAQYLLWDTASGAPPLDNPNAVPAATSERYNLYSIE